MADTPKRDPRADPDDDPPASARVDVVNVDRTGGLASAANTLRRDLARLQQQAAVVEQTLEEHRRQQTDALERLERATEHALELQARLQQSQAEVDNWRRQTEAAQAELQTVRGERDDLERAIEAAKAAALDVGRMREEAEGYQKERDALNAHATKLESDLEEAHAKVKAATTSANDLTAELEAFREKEKESATKAAGLVAEVANAREKEKESAARTASLTSEIAALKEKLERNAAELQQANQAAAQGKMESLRAREDANEAREAVKSLREELERERTKNEESLAVTQTDLEAVKRELDETRADVTNATRELDATRVERDVLAERATMLERDLEQAKAETARAEARVVVAERARSIVEEGIRQLRSEITAAFGRVRAIAPSSPPPKPRTVPPPLPEQAPPAQGPTATSFPPVVAEAPPLSIPPAPPAPKTIAEDERALGLDDGWRSPSEPPPPPAATPRKLPSIRAPSGSIPPVYYPSVPPVATTSSAPNDVAVIGTKAAPSELFELLFDPETARDAVDMLREHPEWLKGPPPAELIGALAHVDYDAEGAVFELARAWEREELCVALIASLKAETNARLREHGAWLLKHLGSPAAWKAIAELAASEKEPLMVRRWLLEALDRLAAGRSIGWKELGETVTSIAKHPDPALRDGAVGVLMSLERSDEKRGLLLDILQNDDDEVVLASAVHALASVLPVQLDKAVVERLLGHPSQRVQRSVSDLIERSKSELTIN